MFHGHVVEVLLIEDEEFDVRRVKNTIRPFTDRIHIRDVVSNGAVALELIRANKEQYDVVIMDFEISPTISSKLAPSGIARSIQETWRISFTNRRISFLVSSTRTRKSGWNGINIARRGNLWKILNRACAKSSS